ncbi:MAG: protein kinase [Anaerolineae bacterium]|nr:protein kinase [Anaerolineae bacterium]
MAALAERASVQKIVNNRYILTGKLGSGGMGAVYRATDRLTGQTVALKRVTVSSDELLFTSKPDDSSADFYLALANEFQTLASLRHPYIISVLDYGFDTAHPEARLPFFTMAYVEGAKNILDVGKTRPMPDRLALVMQLLQALHYLHRRNVLHRDLKPPNILIEDMQVQVVDFGLAAVSTLSGKYPGDAAAGTFAYMAPELFTDCVATRASDLYAVGVILYELLAGHHPFDVKRPAHLLHSVLNDMPDVASITDNEKLSGLLSRLLRKSPEERYQQADEVLRDLCAATNTPYPAETIELRESLLQKAQFVGRGDELDRLVDHLNTLRDSKGAVCLVAGESGVGKSRLLHELRTRALVQGVTVLQGQAISEGGSPYGVWRDILRWLCLLVDLTDNEASVLKPFVPDIEALIGRAIPDAPVLDPQAAQNRLLTILTDIFRRQRQPLAIILEDLHWVGGESKAIINRLQTSIADWSLLIIGSYRDDEAPGLPAEIPQAHVIKLNRLNLRDIEQLTNAMLGQKEGALTDYLYRETEGNAFFLVEILRALAEETGQLERVGEHGLPEDILPGGIRRLVQHRLERIPADALELLKYAAAIARQVDLELLTALAPARDLDRWIVACSSAAILESEGTRWRFSHDKIRTGVLAMVEEPARVNLHQQIATALERLRGDAPEHAAALAYHYRKAQNPEKAVQYLWQAAAFASANHANDAALHFHQERLEQLTCLLNQDAVRWTPAVIQTYEALGDVLEFVGNRHSALDAYHAALGRLTASDPILESRLHRKIADVWVVLHQYDKAIEGYNRADAVRGAAPAATGEAWRHEWLANHLSLMLTYYWTGRLPELMELSETLRPHVEQYGTAVQQSTFFSYVAIARLRRERYVASGETVAFARRCVDALDNLHYVAEYPWAVFVLGFCLLWHGELDRAEQQLKETAEVARRFGDITIQSRSVSYLTVVARKKGRINDVRQYAAQSLAAASGGQMVEYAGMAKANLAWADQREGKRSAALENAIEALDLLKKVPQGQMFPWVAHWPMIGLQLAQDQLAAAIDSARALFDPQANPQPEALAEPLQQAIRDWEQGAPEQARELLLTACERAKPLGYL